MPPEIPDNHPEFQEWQPDSPETDQSRDQAIAPDAKVVTTEEVDALTQEYHRVTERLKTSPTQEDKLIASRLGRKLNSLGVEVEDSVQTETPAEEASLVNKAGQQPTRSQDPTPPAYGILDHKLSRRTAIKAGGAAVAGAAIVGTEAKTGIFRGMWRAYKDWSDRWRTESAARQTEKGLGAAAEEMIPPTPTPPPPTEAPTPTPSAEQLAYQEFQTEIDRYLNKFVEMGEDEELGAGGAMPLVMVADRFTVDELVAYAKEAGSHGDFIDPEEAAYFTAAGLENGIDPVAASEMFSQVTDDLGIADQRTAALVAIAMKYSVDAKQVADDLYPITKSTQARGSITLLPLYYQGYSVEQIDELFKEVQDLTKEQYNDGIDEVVTYLQAQDVLPAQQMYELMDHVKDRADTIRDLPALYLALTIHIGKSEEEVFEQFERLKDQMEGLRSSVKESAAAVLILKAASRDSTIAGIQDIVSESNYAMSAWWSLFGPNGLMPIKF